MKKTYKINKVEDKEDILRECYKSVKSGEYKSENKGVYEIFGARKFKDYLLKNNNQERYHLNGKSLEDLKEYKGKSKDFEKKHIIGGLASLALTAPVLFSDESSYVKAGALGICAGINIVCNAYPVLVQKYNQKRLDKVINKMEKRKDE